jgi:predicted dehydrogenase
MSLRVGIISANWGAFAHLPAWRSLPGVEVAAICTSRQETAEAAARKFQIARPFWDAEAMCADPELDIIDCGTRPIYRHKMVLGALKHRKHVYNAIPCAANIDHAREMHRCWSDSGAVAVVDAYSQWLPAHRLAREMLDQGFLGQPFGGTCQFNISLFNQPIPQFPYNWFSQGGQGVSAMRNLGSHALHMLVHLFGAIEEVIAHDGQLLKQWDFPDGQAVTPQTNDFASLMLRFASGMLMQMQVSWSATVPGGWLIDAFGSKGRFVVTSPTFPTSGESVLRAASLGGKLETLPIPERLQKTSGIGIDWQFPVPPAYPMALSMQRMIEAITTGAKAAPDFDQAWAVERVLEAARLSNEQRCWVRPDRVV